MWIAGMFHFLASHPQVLSFVWFDINKETNWRLENSTAASRAFATGVQNARYR